MFSYYPRLSSLSDISPYVSHSAVVVFLGPVFAFADGIDDCIFQTSPQHAIEGLLRYEQCLPAEIERGPQCNHSVLHFNNYAICL